jgi:WD40 repeat protein
MPVTTRTFRVFVSSTFEDLVGERNALWNETFPRLSKLCQSHGARFQAIDLRWGIRTEAALDQKTMEICFAEIERCQRTGIKPNFIVLLGDRYGWRPLPARIEALEFEAVTKKISNIADRALIDGWYQLDENAVPPEYLLKVRTGEFIDNDHWGMLEERMRMSLRAAAGAAGISGDAIIKYEASAVHQEILRGLGATPADREHVFAFLRERKKDAYPRTKRALLPLLLGARSGDAAREPDLQRLRQFLNTQLGDRVFSYPEGNFTTLCSQVERSLTAVILSQLAGFESRPMFQWESAPQETFAKNRSDNFAGREAVLHTIASYIDSESHQPLVIYGASGSGKSAVMAKASDLAANTSPRAVTVRRFIGATLDSSAGLTLIRSLCDEIAHLYEISEEAPIDFNLLVKTFHDRLALGTADRPLRLFIDAVDQLDPRDPATTRSWLPAAIPSYCRIIISTTEVPQPLRNANIVQLDALPVADADEALSAWLGDAHRTLQPDQRSKLLDYFSRCGLPLYLKLAFEEARNWRSFDEAGACILNKGLAGIIGVLVTRLSSDGNHGQVLVSRSLGYLATARYGLTEDEVLELLATDNDLWEDFIDRAKHTPPARQLPAIVWSRLFLDLEPYLMERAAPGGTVISFYHRQLLEFVGDRVLPESVATARRQALIQYFGAQPLWFGEDFQQPNARKAVEMVYQLRSARRLNEASSTLTDLDFVAAKCAAALVFDLQEDYRETIAALAYFTSDEGERAAALSVYRDHLLQFAKGETLSLMPVRSVRPRRTDLETMDRSPEIDPIFDIEAFQRFVVSQAHLLSMRAGSRLFVLQLAFDSSRGGPVANAAERLLASVRSPRILEPAHLRRVWNPFPAQITTVEAYKELRDRRVASLDFSANGQQLLTLGGGQLLLWHIEGEELWKTQDVEASGNDLYEARLSADGSRIIARGRFGFCVMTANGAVERQIKTNESGSGLTITADGRWAATYRGRVLHEWNMEAASLYRSLETESCDIDALAMSADGRRIVTAHHDVVILIHDIANRTPARRIPLVCNALMPFFVRFTPDARLLVVYAKDREHTLSLLGPRGWEMSAPLGEAPIVSVAVTRNNKLVFVAQDEGTIRAFDTATGACIHTFDADFEGVGLIALRRSDRELIAIYSKAGSDRVMKKTWSLTYMSPLSLAAFDQMSWMPIALLPDGKTLVTEEFYQSGRPSMLEVRNFEDGQLIRTLGPCGNVTSNMVVFAEAAFAGGWGTGILTWDMNNSSGPHTIVGEGTAVRSLDVDASRHRAIAIAPNDAAGTNWPSSRR